MSRAPSDATKLRTALADLKVVRKNFDNVQAQLYVYRVRATKAEQEAADWRKRFDALLLRTPEVKS